MLSAYTEHWEFWTGWVLLAVVLFARQGLAGIAARAPARKERAATTAPLLDVRGLHKRFGGVVATDGVDLQVRAGEIHALIGPNGAGKTTLVAQLARPARAATAAASSSTAPTSRALPPHQRARRGLARSFQITRLFSSFERARQRRAGGAGGQRRAACRAWRPAQRDRALFERAREVLADARPRRQGRARASTQLSHGERRALEVGMALASRPRLVLLDEPMAGMGPDESARMEALIAAPARQHAPCC